MGRRRGGKWGRVEESRYPALPRWRASRSGMGCCPRPGAPPACSRSRPLNSDTAPTALRPARHPPGPGLSREPLEKGAYIVCRPGQERKGGLPAPEEAPKSTSRPDSAPPLPCCPLPPPSATKWQSQVLRRQGAESAGPRVSRSLGRRSLFLQSSPNLLPWRISGSCGLCREGRQGLGRGDSGPFGVPRPPRSSSLAASWRVGPRGPGGVIHHPDGGSCLLKLDISSTPASRSTRPVGPFASFSSCPPASGPFGDSHPSPLLPPPPQSHLQPESLYP